MVGGLAWSTPRAGNVHLHCLRWIAACRMAECKTRTLRFRPHPMSLSWHSSPAEPEASYSQLGIYYFSDAVAENHQEKKVPVSMSLNLYHFSFSHIKYVSNTPPTTERPVKLENHRSAWGKGMIRKGERAKGAEGEENYFPPKTALDEMDVTQVKGAVR